MKPSIKIKGIREGLLIDFLGGNWPELQEEFLWEIDKQVDFFQGARIILDVHSHILNAATLGKLRDLLSDRGVSVWAVLGESPQTEENARMLGFATRIHQPKPEPVGTKSIDTHTNGEEAVLIRRNLRSGNTVEYFGHIVILGDVNPGAELVAGGDIVVFGKLRGLAHAGAEGNSGATISALEMNPTQLWIADRMLESNDSRRKGKDQPQTALLKDGQIVLDKWEF